MPMRVWLTRIADTYEAAVMIFLAAVFVSCVGCCAYSGFKGLF